MRSGAATPMQPRGRSADETDLVVVTAAAPSVPVARLLAAPIQGEALLFADPREGGWSFAGRGEVARIEARGPGRFDEVRARGGALLGAVRERRADGTELAPPPCLLGGFAFADGAMADEPPWRAFASASFTMPRWLYMRRGDRAFVRLAMRAGEAARCDAGGEIGRVIAAIAQGDAAPLDHAAPRPSVEPMAEAAWAALVEGALAHIRSGAVAKIVAARTSFVTAVSDLDAVEAAWRLLRGHPACVIFAFERGGATFFGATPERLVTVSGARISTEALAGTIAADADAGALLASDKDGREHALVVAGIREVLAPMCDELRIPEAPVVRRLRDVTHLATPIEGRLRGAAHVLEVVRAMHPTAAVCGAPRAAAAAWIAAHEPAPRGWYAAPVGWFDAAGDGAFAVAIRSAVTSGRRAWVFAGAGIVEGSDARLEYAETTVKQAAVLSAIGAWP